MGYYRKVNRLDIYIEQSEYPRLLMDYNDYLDHKGKTYLERYEYVCIVRLFLIHIGSLKKASLASYRSFIIKYGYEIQNGNPNFMGALFSFSSFLYLNEITFKDYMKAYNTINRENDISIEQYYDKFIEKAKSSKK